jgi:hypothetical protein
MFAFERLTLHEDYHFIDLRELGKRASEGFLSQGLHSRAMLLKSVELGREVDRGDSAFDFYASELRASGDWGFLAGPFRRS